MCMRFYGTTLFILKRLRKGEWDTVIIASEAMWVATVQQEANRGFIFEHPALGDQKQCIPMEFVNIMGVQPSTASRS